MFRLYLLSLLCCTFLSATTFDEAIEQLRLHDTLKATAIDKEIIAHQGVSESALNNPMVKVAAKNFPISSLALDKTPMTGIDFGITQTLPVTSKYSHIKSEFKHLQNAQHYRFNDLFEQLKQKLWSTLIHQHRLHQELSILEENLDWITNLITVSQTLYATGKSTRQATLELQIRRNQLVNAISNKQFEVLQLEDSLEYLVHTRYIQPASIPWQTLEYNSTPSHDNQAKLLQAQILAYSEKYTASKLASIPDITLSVAYTARAYMDYAGDFISLSLALPLPITQNTYAKQHQARTMKEKAALYLEDYYRNKQQALNRIKHEVDKLDYELSTINNEMIEFAKSARDITASSYRVGHSSYVELLQSEMNLQSILLRKVQLEAEKQLQIVQYKYHLGEIL